MDYFCVCFSPIKMSIYVGQLTFEEAKEADSTTRQASHRVSRGLYDKVVSFPIFSFLLFIL